MCIVLVYSKSCECFCFCRLHHRRLPQPLLWHPVLHGRAEPNPHLLREVSTGWLFTTTALCVERSAVTPFRPFVLSQGNRTELCRNCKDKYRQLNEIYGQKEKNQTMCIDIEDSVSWISREGIIHHFEQRMRNLNVVSRPEWEFFLRLTLNTASDLIRLSLCQWNSL